jgi:signal peptidase II
MLEKRIFILYLSIITFALDRVSKLYILELALEKNITNISITSFLNFNLIFNKGIAFGLLSFDHKFYYHVVTFVIIIVSIVILYLALKSTRIERLGFSLIFGGSFGNIFDRLYYGSVVDFIDININNIHWFIFNFADIFITIGVVLLILIEVYKKKK